MKKILSIIAMFMITNTICFSQDTINKKWRLSSIDFSFGYFNIYNFQTPNTTPAYIDYFKNPDAVSDYNYDAANYWTSYKSEKTDGSNIKFLMGLQSSKMKIKNRSEFLFGINFHQNINFRNSIIVLERHAIDTFANAHFGQDIFFDSVHVVSDDYNYSFNLFDFIFGYNYMFFPDKRYQIQISPYLGLGITLNRHAYMNRYMYDKYMFFLPQDSLFAQGEIIKDYGSIETVYDDKLTNLFYMKVGVPIRASLGLGNEEKDLDEISIFFELSPNYIYIPSHYPVINSFALNCSFGVKINFLN